MKNKLQEAHLIFLSREQEYFIVVVFLVVATKGNLICSVFPKTGKKSQHLYGCIPSYCKDPTYCTTARVEGKRVTNLMDFSHCPLC